MTDKRSYHRFQIWFPVTLVIGERQVWAICRDASSGGVLLSAESPIEVGTKLEARFKVSPRARAERAIMGKAIRTESCLATAELMQAFPYRVAVQFAKPVHDLLDDLARFSDTLVW